MANVEFHDNSMQVKQALENIAVAWLHTWGNETAAQAKRNTSTEGWTNGERTALRDSYDCVVDDAQKVARVGTSLEQGYWEEFGTGEHADTSKNGGREGRKDWWVYVAGQEPRDKESTHYATKEEAEAVAASMREDGFDAYATNGREPHYTLEKAFIAVKPKAIRDLENKTKGMG